MIPILGRFSELLDTAALMTPNHNCRSKREAFNIQTFHYGDKAALRRGRLIPPVHPGTQWQFTSRRGRLGAKSPYFPL